MLTNFISVDIINYEIESEKKVTMEYYNLEGGTVDFSIKTNYTNRNKKIVLTFWNTWDNFDEYVLWMENVLKGGNNCIYTHTPEDVPFYFKYYNEKFFVYTWQNTHVIDYLIEVEINRIDLVYELYNSFRNFIDSSNYDYKLWESITFQDYLMAEYGTIDKALEMLLEMNYSEIINLLNKCAIECDDEPCFAEDAFEDFTKLDTDKKIDYIKTVIFTEGFGLGNGLCLRKLKSEFIENFFEEITKQN